MGSSHSQESEIPPKPPALSPDRILDPSESPAAKSMPTAPRPTSPCSSKAVPPSSSSALPSPITSSTTSSPLSSLPPPPSSSPPSSSPSVQASQASPSPMAVLELSTSPTQQSSEPPSTLTPQPLSSPQPSTPVSDDVNVLPSSDSSKKCFYSEPSATALDISNVRALRAAKISEIAAVLSVPVWIAEKLLTSTAWNTSDAVVSALQHLADDEGGSVLTASALTNDCPLGWTVPTNPKDLTCCLCFEALDNRSFYSDCEKSICGTCWKNYLRVAVDASATRPTCPMPGCSMPVPEQLVEFVIPIPSKPVTGQDVSVNAEQVVTSTSKSDEKTVKSFWSAVTRGFVQTSHELQWCANPACDLVIQRGGTDVASTQCTCKFSTCWSCGLECHFPLSCSFARDWGQVNRKDVSSRMWIVSNTRTCPGCHIPIEKNGGCNHMICDICKHDFHWNDASIWEGGDSLLPITSNGRLNIEGCLKDQPCFDAIKLFKTQNERVGHLRRLLSQISVMNPPKVMHEIWRVAVDLVFVARRKVKWAAAAVPCLSLKSERQLYLDGGVNQLNDAVDKLQCFLRSCDADEKYYDSVLELIMEVEDARLTVDKLVGSYPRSVFCDGINEG